VTEESKPFKFLVTQEQWDWYRDEYVIRFPESDTDAFMESMFDLYEFMPPPPTKAQLEVQAIIKAMYKNEAGESLHIGYYKKPRVNLAIASEVSGLRGLRYQPDSVYFDEPYHPAAPDCEWSNGVTASQWLEHRMFCTRAVLECLSGK